MRSQPETVLCHRGCACRRPHRDLRVSGSARRKECSLRGALGQPPCWFRFLSLTRPAFLDRSASGGGRRRNQGCSEAPGCPLSPAEAPASAPPQPRILAPAGTRSWREGRAGRGLGWAPSPLSKDPARQLHLTLSSLPAYAKSLALRTI